MLGQHSVSNVLFIAFTALIITAHSQFCKLPKLFLGMHQEVGLGAEGIGDRELSATATAYQPSSRVLGSSQLPSNQRHFHLVEAL